MEESHNHTQTSIAPQVHSLIEDEDEDEETETETIQIDRDEQTQTETQSRATVTGKKRKKIETRSPAWDDFDEVFVEEGDPPVQKRKGQCKRCGTLIAADSTKNGTSALKKHTKSCKKKLAASAGQKQLSLQPGFGSESAKFSSWKFEQKDSRLALCEMIILDELPFKFIEKEGFKRFVARVCPQFKIPSRQTIREDCVKLFLEKQEMLKAFLLKKGKGRVSITTDCWTATNSINFICVTAHFIDKDWVLHKKIIGFRKITSHKGTDIGEAIVEVLKEWRLEDIMCCTVDNASSNDGAVKYISDFLDQRKTNVMWGKYLHMRCAAHITNLIVNDGLDDIGMAVRRVREAVKWIRASPKRIDEFKKLVRAFVTTDCKKFLSQDVSTRWNSTYLMLESAEPFEAAFKVLACSQSSYANDLNQKQYMNQPVGPPQDEDWINVRKIIEYLEIFYDFTLLASGTNYVTAHLFLKEMCDIFNFISDLEGNIDDDVRAMAIKMKQKIGKYWLEEKELNPKLNKLLYIAAVLDPRQKLKHVEMCLTEVYGNVRGVELMAYVRDWMTELFEAYKKQLTAASMSSATSRATAATSQSQTSTIAAPHRQRHRQRGSRVSLASIPRRNVAEEPDDISELNIYLSEKQYVEDARQMNDDDMSKINSFDILNWWKTHGARYPVLSEMAKDILAIPISTVASESAFSTAGRILDEFRSSLTPMIVEALICSGNWLRSSTIFMNDEEDLTEEEEIRIFELVLTSLESIGDESGAPTGTAMCIGAGTGSGSSVAMA